MQEIKASQLFCDPSLFLPKSGEDEKEHSREIDYLLGFEPKAVEDELQLDYPAFSKIQIDNDKDKHFDETQPWIGLNPQTLQTPYSDIFKALNSIKTNSRFSIESIVDIGAAYGRVGIVSRSLFQESRFIGYEIMTKRVDEGNRIFKKHGLNYCELIQKNVLDKDFDLPNAQIYFIYDFSEPDHLKVILDKVAAKIGGDPYYLLIRGYGMESLMDVEYKNVWKKETIPADSLLKIYSKNLCVDY